MSDRPSVDVVVPFAGSVDDFEDLLERLARLSLNQQDTLTVVDNRREPLGLRARGRLQVMPASERASSYFARNRGAAHGLNDWLLFIDADVQAPFDLLDRYFVTPVSDPVGLVAGGVIERVPPGVATWAGRWAELRQVLNQEASLKANPPYACTANCLVRRFAFGEIGGFCDDIRSGGDVDFSLRLRTAGWTLALRREAEVVHQLRVSIRALLRQHARYGSGAAWLNRRYSGIYPRQKIHRLAIWSIRATASGVVLLLRGRRDAAIPRLIDPLVAWAVELGRLAPNRSA